VQKIRAKKKWDKIRRGGVLIFKKGRKLEIESL
jgi:hypothetical protein